MGALHELYRMKQRIRTVQRRFRAKNDHVTPMGAEETAAVKKLHDELVEYAKNANT